MRPLAVCFCAAAWSVAAAAGPNITGATPNPIDAGGPYFPMTITGSGFVNGSIAHWGGAILSTTYVNSGLLIAEISPDLRLIADTYSLTVTNPDRTTSNSYGIVVSPVLAFVSPTGAVSGSGPLTISLKGIGFQSRFVAQLSSASGPVNLATTMVDTATLTATIPASALAQGRTATLQVVDPLYGGTSGTLLFEIRATPVISAVSPTPVDAGGVYFLLNISGSGFNPGAVVKWPDGTALATSYLTPTQMKAAITPDLRVVAGAFPLTVSDPLTGAVSNSVPLVVSPVLFSLTPATAAVGGGPVTITAGGIGFTNSTTLSLTQSGRSTNLSTTYIDSKTLTATIPAGALATAGSLSIQAVDGAGGGQSLPQTFKVAAGIPIITGLSPAIVTAGTPAFTLSVSGANFAGGATVSWNGASLPTTFLSAGQLAAAVSASAVQNAGSAAITVANPGGPSSAPATFTIHAPPPALSSISPVSAVAGASAFTLIVNGTNCGANCMVQWNGVALATAAVNSGQFTAPIAAGLIGAPGTATVRLVNAEGTGSNAATFVINPAAPTLASVSPNEIAAGSSSVSLTITGSGFVSGAIALWNGAPLSTTFVSSTQVTASVSGSLATGLVSATVAVSNPGGALSNTLTVAIDPPKPVVSSLSPSSAPVGGGSFTLTITGQNFAVNGVARWNGSPLFTTVLGAGQITATVPADRIAAAGLASITVANPSGLESNAATFTISPASSIESISPSSALPGAAGLSLTVTGSGFTAASAVLWNNVPLATTFVSSGGLQADIPAALLAVAGQASITVLTAGAASANSAVFTVGSPAPAISDGGVVNAAGAPTAIAPGSLISIYGVNLGPSAPAGATTLPLPSDLNGVSVSVNGLAAPILFAGPTQINAQLPFETAPGAAKIVVQVGALSSAPYPVQVQAVAPGLFPVIQNCPDGGVNSPQTPVPPGQYVTIWMTGQGAVNPQVATGAAALADPISYPAALVRAQIGGKEAQVAFAGLAPGMAGLLQVNLLVPDLPAGTQQLTVTVGDAVSNAVTISIGQ